MSATQAAKQTNQVEFAIADSAYNAYSQCSFRSGGWVFIRRFNRDGVKIETYYTVDGMESWQGYAEGATFARLEAAFIAAIERNPERARRSCWVRENSSCTV
jgi:hypothetical protein